MNCKKCGAEYDNGGNVNRRYCDTCRGSRNGARDTRIAASHQDTACTGCGRTFTATTVRTTRCPDCTEQAANDRAQHNVPFIGIDGEGVTGPCMKPGCDCPKYIPADETDKRSRCATCGHQKSARRIPGNTTIQVGHEHQYVMLRCGSQVYENTAGIYIGEALTFLYGCGRDQAQNTAYVIYGGGYDFTQLFKTLPEERAARLLLPEAETGRKQWQPLDFRDRRTDFEWELRYLPNRTFSFRPKDKELWFGNKGWMTVCDVISFWQSSFVKAINPGDYPPGEAPCSQEAYDEIIRGKERRAHAELDDEMRYYNRLEVEALENLMGIFNRTLVRKLGVRLSKHQWYGPGQIAAKLLRKWGAPKRTELEEIIPADAQEALRASYYGGWFEIFMHGPVTERLNFFNGMTFANLPAVTYGYDINSAYPYIIKDLPCPLHGKWTHGKGTKLPSLRAKQYRVVHAKVHGSDPYIGTMPHRLLFSHNIVRPHNTEGWYWQHELEASQQAGLIDSIEPIEWHTYTACDCPPPCREIASLYEARRNLPNVGSMKGKNTPAGRTLKLGYNSAYGKLAQTTGGECPYLNWMWASLITAGCRVKILGAIASHPEGARSVAMVATDAVFFTSPHPSLPLSDRLGEWDDSQYADLSLYKPGFYTTKKSRIDIMNGKPPAIKSRGINAKAVSTSIAELDQTCRNWKPGDDWPSVTFPVDFEMTNCVQALRQGSFPGRGQKGMVSRWYRAGMVFEGNLHSQRMDPGDKRKVCTQCQFPNDNGHQHNTDAIHHDRYAWRTAVYEYGGMTNGEPQASMPYNKNLSVRAVFDSGLVPAFGITPEGVNWDLIVESLGLG